MKKLDTVKAMLIIGVLTSSMVVSAPFAQAQSIDQQIKTLEAELAQNARSIFQSSQPAQKNKILKALLANCQINEKRLQLNLLKPFSVLIDSTLSQNWLTTTVLN